LAGCLLIPLADVLILIAALIGFAVLVLRTVLVIILILIVILIIHVHFLQCLLYGRAAEIVCPVF